MKNHLLHLRDNEDGLWAELELTGCPSEPWTPWTEYFRSGGFLRLAYLNHCVMTWTNPYGICPDVLRLRYERGRMLSEEETISGLQHPNSR